MSVYESDSSTPADVVSETYRFAAEDAPPSESATVAVTVNVLCPSTFERVGALSDTEIVERAPATAKVTVVEVSVD